MSWLLRTETGARRPARTARMPDHAAGRGPAPGEPASVLDQGNGALWTQLRPGGTVAFVPGGPGSVEQDGTLGITWSRRRDEPSQGNIQRRHLHALAAPLRAATAEGHPLDAAAPIPRAHRAASDGEIGFQATSLFFPSSCALTAVLVCVRCDQVSNCDSGIANASAPSKSSQAGTTVRSSIRIAQMSGWAARATLRTEWGSTRVCRQIVWHCTVRRIHQNELNDEQWGPLRPLPSAPIGWHRSEPSQPERERGRACSARRKRTMSRTGGACPSVVSILSRGTGRSNGANAPPAMRCSTLGSATKSAFQNPSWR